MSNHAVQQIVVNIQDPAEVDQPALSAAIAIADESARFYLFHNLYHPNLGEDLGDAVIDEARTLLAHAHRQRLKEVAQRFLPDSDYETHVAIEKDSWQTLIRFSVNKNADLLVANTQSKSRWERLRLHNDDWELIRHCPVPLLFARSDSRHQYQRIVAAVDPLHADDKPAELDRLITRYAGHTAKSLRADLCLFNVAQVAVALPPVAMDPMAATVPVDTRALENHTDAVQSLANECGSENTRIEVRSGIAGDEIVQFVEEESADLLIMGAVSRSTISRLLIGNTAENVLDALPCDVLVIKPPHLNRTSRAILKLNVSLITI